MLVLNLPMLTESVNQNIEIKLQYFYDKNEIPHIIFHGKSGTGKKTIVHQFINKIYNNNKSIIKENVMFVNCSQGKGIKFIREELKFFAKTNVQLGLGIQFKIIVLLNADYLTIDAQSALRRCIELFSYNTRFFIIVENKNKLLKPILSRFCEIYVPERDVNLHQYNIQKTINMVSEKERKMEWIKTHFNSVVKTSKPNYLIHLSSLFYENGLSCLDLIDYIESCEDFDIVKKTNISLYFYKIKSEFYCEKMLLFSLFDFLFHGTDERLLKISQI
jgi:DNA polymerase III delta prime subunit